MKCCHNCHVYILFSCWLIFTSWTVQNAWSHAIVFPAGSQRHTGRVAPKVSFFIAGADGRYLTKRCGVGAEGAARCGIPAAACEAECDVAGQWCSASLEGQRRRYPRWQHRSPQVVLPRALRIDPNCRLAHSVMLLDSGRRAILINTGMLMKMVQLGLLGCCHSGNESAMQLLQCQVLMSAGSLHPLAAAACTRGHPSRWQRSRWLAPSTAGWTSATAASPGRWRSGTMPGRRRRAGFETRMFCNPDATGWPSSAF